MTYGMVNWVSRIAYRWLTAFYVDSSTKSYQDDFCVNVEFLPYGQDAATFGLVSQFNNMSTKRSYQFRHEDNNFHYE